MIVLSGDHEDRSPHTLQILSARFAGTSLSLLVWLQVRQQEHAFLREGRARGVDSCRQFMQQMGYREYARYLSFHFPFTHERSLLEHLCFVPWRLDQRLFKVVPTLCPSIEARSGLAAWLLMTWHKNLSLRCNQKAIGVLKIWGCS